MASERRDGRGRNPVRRAVVASALLVGRGIEEMPFGPPVKFCQFSSTSRMISPNAMVTMAR